MERRQNLRVPRWHANRGLCRPHRRRSGKKWRACPRVATADGGSIARARCRHSSNWNKERREVHAGRPREHASRQCLNHKQRFPPLFDERRRIFRIRVFARELAHGVGAADRDGLGAHHHIPDRADTGNTCAAATRVRPRIHTWPVATSVMRLR